MTAKVGDIEVYVNSDGTNITLEACPCEGAGGCDGCVHFYGGERVDPCQQMSGCYALIWKEAIQ